jgi:hypothetical protein
MKWNEVKDGIYRVSMDGKPPWFTVTIKGEYVTYYDGSKGPLSDIYGRWIIEKM